MRTNLRSYRPFIVEISIAIASVAFFAVVIWSVLT
jgi:hydrogenase-4 membrane subunit HyfE